MQIQTWIEANEEFSLASHHFGLVVALCTPGGFTSPVLDNNRAQQAFVQALLAGQTALEKGLSQVIAVFQEDIPGSGGPGLDLIKGVRFLGTTLWTDYRLNLNCTQRQLMEHAQTHLNDHQLIRSAA